MAGGRGWRSKFIYLMKMSKGFCGFHVDGVPRGVPRGSVVTGRHSSGVSTQSINPVGLHPTSRSFKFEICQCAG